MLQSSDLVFNNMLILVLTVYAFLQILLLMATALNISVPGSAHHGVIDSLAAELRTRQQCIAEITEMIHVSFLFCASLSVMVWSNIHESKLFSLQQFRFFI